MPTWDRTIRPRKVSQPVFPGPQFGPSQSGKINTRSTTQVGMTWSEEYLLDNSSADARTLAAIIRDYHRRGQTFDINLQWNLVPLGGVAGTAANFKVKGANQTGTTLDMDGATAAQTPWIKGGDVVTIAGLTLVYEITADANSDGSGNVTLPISPAIFSGNSPADGALITVTAVTAQAKIVGYDAGEMRADEHAVYKVVFQEAP